MQIRRQWLPQPLAVTPTSVRSDTYYAEKKPHKRGAIGEET